MIITTISWVDTISSKITHLQITISSHRTVHPLQNAKKSEDTQSGLLYHTPQTSRISSEDGNIHRIYQNVACKMVPEDCVINGNSLDSTSKDTAEKDRLYKNQLTASRSLKKKLPEGRQETNISVERISCKKKDENTRYSTKQAEDPPRSAQWVSPIGMCMKTPRWNL